MIVQPFDNHAPPRKARNMKIYTKTGDEGETGLFAGPRVGKEAERIEAYGQVDELNTVLGMARAENLPSEINEILGKVQNQLFELGAELATPDAEARGTNTLDDAAVAMLEEQIDRHEENLPPLKQFILPGGTRGAAVLHFARSVCRRAERRVVALSRIPDEKVTGLPVQYLNRLSDLLFVLARAASLAAGKEDLPWQKG